MSAKEFTFSDLSKRKEKTKEEIDEEKMVIIKGVRVVGDLNNVKSIKAIGRNIIVKTNNDRFFFATRTKYGDEFYFNTKYDEMHVYSSGITQRRNSVPAKGIIKHALVRSIPFLAGAAAFVTCSVIDNIYQTDVTNVLQVLSSVALGSAMGYEVAYKIENGSENRSYKKSFPDRLKYNNKPIEGFDFKDSKIVKTFTNKEYEK